MSFLDTEPTIKVDLTTTTCDNLVVEILKTVILDDLSSDLVEDELKNAMLTTLEYFMIPSEFITFKELVEKIAEEAADE
jgi:hypothetical protein|tara:strand:+ start:16 stop:252 length:237 start_codon:yes stop_codon:yes gene_type:complete